MFVCEYFRLTDIKVFECKKLVLLLLFIVSGIFFVVVVVVFSCTKVLNHNAANATLG